MQCQRSEVGDRVIGLAYSLGCCSTLARRGGAGSSQWGAVLLRSSNEQTRICLSLSCHRSQRWRLHSSPLHLGSFQAPPSHSCRLLRHFLSSAMSLSTALSLESLSASDLFAASERDLAQMWVFYDENGNGLIELAEFTELMTEVLNRLAAQLPAMIPAKYCAEYGLPSSALEGVEARIAAKLSGINRAALAQKLFTELDALGTPTSFAAEHAAATLEARGATEGPQSPSHLASEKALARQASAGVGTVASRRASAVAPSKASLPQAAAAVAAASASQAAAGASAAASSTGGPLGSDASAGSGSDSVVAVGVAVGAPQALMSGGGAGGAGATRGFLEPSQLRPLHALVEKHFLADLYQSIGDIMLQQQLAALDKV